MKKIFCLLLVCVLSVSLLCGCSEINVTLQEATEALAAENAAVVEMTAEHMEKVGIDSEYGFTYFRDVRTDVMYLLYWRKAGYGAGSGLSVMFHPDGTPLLYSEWVELVATDG